MKVLVSLGTVLMGATVGLIALALLTGAEVSTNLALAIIMVCAAIFAHWMGRRQAAENKRKAASFQKALDRPRDRVQYPYIDDDETAAKVFEREKQRLEGLRQEIWDKNTTEQRKREFYQAREMRKYLHDNQSAQDKYLSDEFQEALRRNRPANSGAADPVLPPSPLLRPDDWD